MICKRNICIYLAFIILIFTFILNIKKGGTSYNQPLKRGYLLDRNGEPLVINKEEFQAYYVIRGRSIVGKDIPEEIRRYLPSYFELPKRGLVLIAEGLNYEELQRFQQVENVIIKGEIKRAPLMEEIKPLIGSVYENEGISGLEKIFDSKLKAGESQYLSLDLKFSKRVNSKLNNSSPINIRNLAIFKANTGELLVFLSKEEKNFLLEPIIISPKELGLEISDVTWEMGGLGVKNVGAYLMITPLHIVKGYFARYCAQDLNPTLLLKRKPVCENVQDNQEPIFLVVPDKKQWFFFLLKNEKVYLLTGYLPDSEKDSIDWEKFKKSLMNHPVTAL